MDSGDIESVIKYFHKPGEQNTDETFKLVRKRASELGISTILIASTNGETGLNAVRFFKGYRVIVVSHAYGFSESDVQEMGVDVMQKIEQEGGKVLTMTHAFAGVARAIRVKFGTYETSEIIAYTLRIFGEGMKVVCEIALMAADAGLVKTDEEIIVIAGTRLGSDTSVVLKPVNTHAFFDLRVKEIICKPRL